MKRTISAVALITLIGASSACGVSPESEPFDQNNVSFSGGYALQYEEAYQKAQSDAARRLLIDGSITEAEYEQGLQLYRECLAKDNYQVFEGDHLTDYTVEAPHQDSAKMRQDMARCGTETSFDDIDYLFQMTRMSSNQSDDTVPALVECLKRHGLAEQSLTADDYKQIVMDTASDQEHFGKYFDETRDDYDAEKSPAYWACNADPNS